MFKEDYVEFIISLSFDLVGKESLKKMFVIKVDFKDFYGKNCKNKNNLKYLRNAKLHLIFLFSFSTKNGPWNKSKHLI